MNAHSPNGDITRRDRLHAYLHFRVVVLHHLLDIEQEDPVVGSLRALKRRHKGRAQRQRQELGTPGDRRLRLLGLACSALASASLTQRRTMFALMPFAMATADEPRRLAAGRHDVRLELGAANTPATPALTKGYGSNHFSINSCVEKSVLYRGRISRWAD